MDFGIANVVAITVLVYIGGLLVRSTKLDNKWIPAFCGVFGVLLGIVAFAIGMPDFPAADYINADAIGGAYGLAATGIDQIAKQMSAK